MDNETQKIIEDQMKNLPKDVLEAIISVDYKTKLQEVTKRQRLLIDQAGKLEMETTLVMIGLEPLADYVGNIQREMAVSEARAREIAIDVSDNIFKPIRTSLETINKSLNETPEVIEPDLNRDQILNEIENPVSNHQPAVSTSTAIEIKPAQDIQTIPGQGVKDASLDIVNNKMTTTTITPQQIIAAKPKIKLPELRKSSAGGADPYREPIM